MSHPATSQSDQKVPIRRVEVKNFLSLQNVQVSLGRLNVLVGPNGGGKSNFLSVFRFLGEVARTDLAPALSRLFGGYDKALCRSISVSKEDRPEIVIAVNGEITEHSSVKALDEYRLTFRQAKFPGGRIGLFRHETLLLKRSSGRGRRITLNGARYEYETLRSGRSVEGPRGQIESDASALSVLRRIGKRNDTEQVSQLAEVFEDLRLFDPNVDAARRPASISSDARLNPNASNLASVLAHLNEKQPQVLEAIQDDIRYVLPGFKGFEFTRLTEDANSVQVGMHEKGLLGVTPMAFASYGTVRSIALFTMLRDPDPPRLTCLEEVDHGLHPHALDVLVERLRDASKQSQIIVATHSPALVNRLSAEELIVFERNADSGSTEVPELDPDTIKLMEQSSDLRLGELWYSGLLGGTPV